MASWKLSSVWFSSLGALTGTDDMGRVMGSARVHGEQYVQERGVPFARLVKAKVDRNAALWGDERNDRP